jgi:CBS domain-containing protein
MGSDRDVPEGDGGYLDEEPAAASQSFDATLLEKGLDALPRRVPVVFPRTATVAEAIRAMQHEQRGCVLVTEDGSVETRLIGIFTERDLLYRVVEGRRDPGTARLEEVMTPDPEVVPCEASIAWVLNHMAVGGFRHVPIVDTSGCPAFTVSVRDVVHLLVECFPETVLNLPPRYAADHTKKREGA